MIKCPLSVYGRERSERAKMSFLYILQECVSAVESRDRLHFKKKMTLNFYKLFFFSY